MSANDIKFFTPQIQLLDEVYKNASVTANLDGNSALVSMTANGNEFQIPVMDMDGLGEYNRKTGYPEGGVSLTFETKKPNIDRARVFIVEKMDNQESAGLAFGALSGEFLRTKAVPELDATRLATYCTKGKGKLTKTLDPNDGAVWVKALSNATVDMDNAEVPQNDRHLFITSDGLTAVNNMQTIESRAILARFADATIVPQPRFVSAVKLLSGRDTEDKGGFAKADGATDLQFQIISGSAIMQWTKDIVNKIINPVENQDGDWWKFFFHLYGICEVYDNKVSGIYSCMKEATA